MDCSSSSRTRILAQAEARFDAWLATFWANVERRDPDECWEWLGPKDKDGYGLASMRWTGSTRAQRSSWLLLVGPIPAGMTLDHRCRNRGCVNPAHLDPVPSITNVMRGESAWAVNARKTHCPKGHPYDEENTYIAKDGSRRCRECGREASRECWRRKHPDARRLK